ncbi:ribonuclease Y [Arcobacter porcinus]|uniref:Ribonuclease Y n=1 Tax=Arcobacter porcinus TaxID=1935204 RepID=A0A1C0AZ16_9BACT|nr:ribonuclease Y [Arcobacter porcinus]OCL92359.1 Ribonuclease Y [Aliarcobacter thereius]OCL82705.1 Ribonuclease Y [Arcobacter porcinus]OCL85205.1 Ribonuclease Y [Arcobacter porcinus]OCL85655.1 Ribonuclease Y [Arcobacter porcinus]OCL92891.1 Ribonuclease Y [Arcobacter porcinus]
MESILIAVVAATFSSALTIFVVRKINKAKFEVFIEQAKAKARIIEHEAEVALKDAQIRAKIECDKEFRNAKKDYEQMFLKIERKEQELNEHLECELRQIKREKEQIEDNNRKIKSLKEGIEEQKRSYEQKKLEAIKILENGSGLTKEEAKELLLKKVEEDSRATISSMFRRKYKIAEQNSKQEVNNILSQAVTRYAGEFAAERLINNIPLNDEETKGKIIGKEGRNIKTLEMLLGVDIIIDDTPNTITISSFNLYRRAIATKTIQELLEDGRIQPARIEEIYKKVQAEFDKNIQKEGEDVVMELGIKSMHPELIKLVGRLRYRASYGQNALAHTLEVAHLAGLIAAQMGGDAILARRAGIMHDIGKALTHEAPGSHVDLGADICKRYGECETVINAIYAHHGHEEPINVESAAVCAADALSAARPGARREVLESFLKRVEEIENITTSKVGVTNAYAINAGREVRVIVNAELVNDDEAVLLATEIAKEIEEKVQYPGEIKINVIRELRAESYAR